MASKERIAKVRQISELIFDSIPKDTTNEIAVIALVDVAVKIISVSHGATVAESCQILSEIVYSIAESERGD